MDYKMEVFFSLYKKDLKAMSDVLYQATKYMNAVDTVILSALDLHARPQKIQKYYFLSTGPWEHLERRGATCLGTGVPEVLFH